MIWNLSVHRVQVQVSKHSVEFWIIALFSFLEAEILESCLVMSVRYVLNDSETPLWWHFSLHFITVTQKNLAVGFIQNFWRKITRFHYFSSRLSSPHKMIYTIYLKNLLDLIIIRYLHIKIFGKVSYFCLPNPGTMHRGFWVHGAFNKY